MKSQHPRFSDWWQRRNSGATVRVSPVCTVYTAVAAQGRETQGLAVCSKQKEMAHAITSRSLQPLHHHLLVVRAVVRVGVSHAQTQCLPPSCAQQYIFTRTIKRTCSLDTGTTMLRHTGNKGAQQKLICITKEVLGDHSFVILGCNTNWREEKLSPISPNLVIIVFVIDVALLKGCLGLCVSPFPIYKVLCRRYMIRESFDDKLLNPWIYYSVTAAGWSLPLTLLLCVYLFLQGLCCVPERGAESPDWRKLQSSWKRDEYNCVTVMLKPNEQF